MSAANYIWGKLNELPAVEQMHSFEQCSPLQSIMTLKPYSGQRPLKVIGNDTVIYRPDMTSYSQSIVTLALPCTVSEIQRDIAANSQL